jgi:hypothetical protein
MLCGAALTDAVSGYMALVDIGCASVSVEVQGVREAARLWCPSALRNGGQLQ